MFERITSHKRLNDFSEAPFSIGHLCECLFFYGQVNLVCSRNELVEIIRRTQVDDLLYFLQSGRLRILLKREAYGATQLNEGRFGYIIGLNDTTLGSKVYMAAQHVFRNSTKAMRETDLLMPYIEEHKYDADFVDQFVTHAPFAKTALRAIVELHEPTYSVPEEVEFSLNKTEKLPNDDRELIMENVYEIDTDFDFTAFEHHLALRGKSLSLGFLSQISFSMVGAILDLGLSEQFDSELALTTTSSKILQAGLDGMQLEERDGQNEILSFREHILAPYSSISDAIDTGRKSFSDFAKFDHKTNKFRDWLIGKELNLGIVNEYIKANEVQKFSDSEPGAGLKYVFSAVATTALAAATPGIPAAPSMGALLTLVGNFGVEKVTDSIINKFNRWRPNQFVNKDLREFLNDGQ